MNLMSDFTRGTELIVGTKGYSVPDESVWRELCYLVLLHAHALQQSFPAHSGLWYSPYVQVIFVTSSLEISLLRYGRVTKAGDQLWFLRPLLWWRLEKHQVSKMQSTVLARDEKLNSLAPLEWDIVTTLGCGGRNCGPGVGRKAVSHGDPWAVCITPKALQQTPRARGTDPGDLQLQKQKCSQMTEWVLIPENRSQTQILHSPVF